MNVHVHNLVRACATLSLLAAPLAAHEIGTCGGVPIRWAGTNASFRVDTATMSSSFRSAFQEAVNAWNRTPADFRFQTSTASLWNPFTGNFANEVWMSDDQDLLDGALGVCFSWNACSVRMESDIVFDSDQVWTLGTSRSAMDAYGGSAIPFRAVAIHELGHGLGLRHENDTYNVMGDATTHLQTNGSTSRSYVGEDATNGAVALYGVGYPTRQDLSVAHWRRDGSWNGYSTHSRTRVFRTDGTVAPLWDVSPEPIHEVRRGEQVEVEFTYENNGASSQRPQVRFYVSTNSFISTGDTLLRTTSMTINRNKVFTARHAVTIPSNLTVGQTYWLGVVVDADDLVAEWDEANNATYIGVRVVQ